MLAAWEEIKSESGAAITNTIVLEGGRCPWTKKNALKENECGNWSITF